MKCPKCRARISVFAVRQRFMCRECGTPLALNMTFCLLVAVLPILCAKLFLRSSCTQSVAVLDAPLPIGCDPVVMFSGASAVGLFLAWLAMELKAK